MGPFEIETLINGNYNFMNKTGFMICDINLKKPYPLQQKLILNDSLLKLQYKTTILNLLQSFMLSA
jgi:hypothetical protein